MLLEVEELFDFIKILISKILGDIFLGASQKTEKIVR